ncbi:MAG: KdsC family phosphatase [Candidatus Gastranaerophilaceae bacterium]
MNIPKNIKMVITDFDGIFTDNSIIINEDMSISRKVSFKDVMGVSLLVRNGIDVAIISGEKNSAIELFAQKFKLKEIHMDIRNKLEVLKDILERNNLSKEEVIYIGDDVNDIECLNFVTTKITVPNANKKVKALENIQITETSGGEGAFREIVDNILN